MEGNFKYKILKLMGIAKLAETNRKLLELMTKEEYIDYMTALKEIMEMELAFYKEDLTKEQIIEKQKKMVKDELGESGFNEMLKKNGKQPDIPEDLQFLFNM